MTLIIEQTLSTFQFIIQNLLRIEKYMKYKKTYIQNFKMDISFFKLFKRNI